MKLKDIWRALGLMRTLAPGGTLPLVDRSPDEDWTEAEWDALPWDTSRASDKPTFAEMQQVLDRDRIRAIRRRLCHELRTNCKERITAAYGEDNLDDEIMYRLRMDSSALMVQDAERDRIRERYRQIKGWIEADGTLAQLEVFNPTETKHWEVTAWTPPA